MCIIVLAVLFLGDFTVGRLEQHRTGYFVESWILTPEFNFVGSQPDSSIFFSFWNFTVYFTNVK